MSICPLLDRWMLANRRLRGAELAAVIAELERPLTDNQCSASEIPLPNNGDSFDGPIKGNAEGNE